jgi:hypothetical protein
MWALFTDDKAPGGDEGARKGSAQKAVPPSQGLGFACAPEVSPQIFADGLSLRDQRQE